MVRASWVVGLVVAAAVSSGAFASVPPGPDPAGTAFDAGPLRAVLERRAAACGSEPDCIAGAAAGYADELATRWSRLPRGPSGVAAVVAEALANAGYPNAVPERTDSGSLAAALHRLYAVLGVDPPQDLAQSAEVEPALARALTGLVDAAADASLHARAILSERDRALLDQDLALTLKLATLVGSAPSGSADPLAQRVWEERAAALARVDRAALAAAAQRVADAVSAFPTLPASSQDCAPRLDVPLVRVGGPCDDTYDGLFVVTVDVGGNDTYLNGAGAGPVAGVGVGIALDQGEGNDVYLAEGRAQGFALGGVGVLFDEGGADSYTLTQFGQGFGVAGLGLLYDAGGGDDSYLSPSVVNVTIGTKAGSLGGVGVLVDEGGDDFYKQDGLDGFVYGAAGGHGWLVERGGNDAFESLDMPTWLLGEFLGVFAGPVQVSAEVSGSAVLFEEGGDDAYRCGDHVRQGCQGAGGAGALALLLERGGHDLYEMGVSFSIELGVPVFTMGQGSAYGPSAPGGIGVLVDERGNDAYLAEKWAQGYGSVGLGVLVDGAGADSYSVTSALVPGMARGDGLAWLDGALGVGHDAA